LRLQFCSSSCRRRRCSSTAFSNRDGQFTLENIAGLFQPPIPASYLVSIQISLPQPSWGGLLGFLMAYALTVGNLPRWLRAVTLTFAGVASNFAGVPLAFAFISTLGQVGFVTVLLRNTLMGLEHLRHRLQSLQLPGVEPDLHVLPVSPHAADHGAGHRRSQTRVARGRREPGRQHGGSIGCA
jgi:hypothetical protein